MLEVEGVPYGSRRVCWVGEGLAVASSPTQCAGRQRSHPAGWLRWQCGGPMLSASAQMIDRPRQVARSAGERRALRVGGDLRGIRGLAGRELLEALPVPPS